ncbi:MAG: hypothetical protein Q8N18_01800 [Opitutaceae bacterium]|nr:hypothetical protein [Opitutaceae bacterium]
MINFTEAEADVAVFPEQFRQRHHVGQRLAEMGVQIPDLRRVGTRAREHAGARRRANCLLAIGAVEDHAALGETIDVRALDDRVAIAAELRPEIVGDEKQDIQLGP